MSKIAGVTVGDLKRWLVAFDEDAELYMGGLTFYRFKKRGNLVQLEFSETVYEDESGTIIVEQHDVAHINRQES